MKTDLTNRQKDTRIIDEDNLTVCAECGKPLPKDLRSNYCSDCLEKILENTEIFDC